MTTPKNDSARSGSASPDSSPRASRFDACVMQVNELQRLLETSLSSEREASALLRILATDLPPRFEGILARIDAMTSRQKALEDRVCSLEDMVKDLRKGPK